MVFHLQKAAAVIGRGVRWNPPSRAIRARQNNMQILFGEICLGMLHPLAPPPPQTIGSYTQGSYTL
jgi:hypothetical protein